MSWRIEGRWCRRHWCGSILEGFRWIRQQPRRGQRNLQSCHLLASAYLQSREVDHAVNVWVSVEDLVEVFFFSDVDIEEFRSLATNKLDTIDGFF